ncbi:hypothetical protein AGMMS50233_10500 [Endomicrobiia bacterium]|nr:hypothetical protein AGMMS50233_10500 [Endomicrobiia bacterium]
MEKETVIKGDATNNFGDDMFCKEGGGAAASLTEASALLRPASEWVQSTTMPATLWAVSKAFLSTGGVVLLITLAACLRAVEAVTKVSLAAAVACGKSVDEVVEGG